MSGFEPKSPCPISFNPVNPWRPIRVINVTLFHDSCGTVQYGTLLQFFCYYWAEGFMYVAAVWNKNRTHLTYYCKDFNRKDVWEITRLNRKKQPWMWMFQAIDKMPRKWKVLTPGRLEIWRIAECLHCPHLWHFLLLWWTRGPAWTWFLPGSWPEPLLPPHFPNNSVF